MSIPNRYRDSDKSLNISSEDYLTLADYNDSFYNMMKTSQLRMVIAPGTIKYFNTAFSYDRVTGVQNPVSVSEAALTPLPSRIRSSENDSDYATYPKLHNN